MNQPLIKHRFRISLIGSMLIILAAINKAAGILRYSLGPDELMVWSISRAHSLVELINRNSYEVHPPLEPLIKSLLFSVTDSVYGIRCMYASLAILASFLIAHSLPIRDLRLPLVPGDVPEVSKRESKLGFVFLFSLLALSQTFTHISILLRGYVFLILFISISVFIMRRFCCAESSPTLSHLALITCSTIGAGLSHVSGFIAGPPILLTAILCSRTTTNVKKLYYITFSLGALLSVGTLIYLYQFRAHTGAAHWRELAKSPLFKECAHFYDFRAIAVRLLDLFSILPTTLHTPSGLIITGISGIVLYLIALRYSCKSARWLAMYSSLTLLAMCIAHLLGLYPLSSPRHMVFTLPALLLPIAHYVSQIRISKRQLQLLVVGLFMAGTFTSILNLHFTQHPDFTISKEQQTTIQSALNHTSRTARMVFTSRFGLLYLLKEADDLRTFYMDENLKSFQFGDALIQICAAPKLWQTSVDSLLECTQNYYNLNPSNSSVWLSTIGFTDQRIHDLYTVSRRRNSIMSDLSTSGFLLFEISMDS